MIKIPPLYISEYEKFTLEDIKNHLEGDKEKAGKIFSELKGFAEDERNGGVLGFSKKGILKAKNYVGLIQTKSGFSIEILPKIFNRDKIADDSLCEYHSEKTNQHPKTTFNQDRFKEKVESFNENIIGSNDIDNNIFNSSSCPVCSSKQVLINCLATLKNIPHKASNKSLLYTSHLPLLEIFIIMFIKEVEELVNKGIKSDYVEVLENRNFLKGKLDFNNHIKYNIIHKERFFTKSDEYIQDIAPNRIIKSTLKFLLSLKVSSKTSSRLNALYFIFEDVSLSHDINKDLSQCKSTRFYKEYELILAWCKIFLKKESFTPYSGTNNAFAFLFPMEKLFESFVGYWLRNTIKDYNVSLQDTGKYLLYLTSSENEKNFFKLRPDIVLKSKDGNRIIILDTKWKILKSQDIEKSVAQSDLYQMWAYASKYKKGNKKISTYLIYPLCEGIEDLNEKYTFKADGETSISFKFFPMI